MEPVARSRAARARLPTVAVLLGSAWLLSGGRLTSFAMWRTAASGEAGLEAARWTQRRQLVAGLGLAAAAPALPALAFETLKDQDNGFEFKYPNGYQKSDSKVFKWFARDIIEPLESIGVRITDTSRKSLDEVGDAAQVAEKLIADNVPAAAPKELISAVSKLDKDGRRYDVIEYRYQWKFDKALATQIGRTRFQLHCKALVTVDRKKQYMLLFQTEEPRWEKQGDLLGVTIDTFRLID